MDEREKPLVFIDREGRPGGGKGILISKDLTFTLSGLRQYLMTWEDDCGDLDADGCRDAETESRHSSDSRQPRLQIPPPPRDMGGGR